MPSDFLFDLVLIELLLPGLLVSCRVDSLFGCRVMFEVFRYEITLLIMRVGLNTTSSSILIAILLMEQKSLK